MRDIVLHELIHQWRYEFSGNLEKSYHGHGPEFCRQCNQIGEDLDLPEVIIRRRGPKEADRPLCSCWPQTVRPEGYYLGDVDEAAYGCAKKRRPRHYPDYAMLLQAILGLIDDGRIDFLREQLNLKLEAIQRRRRKGSLAFRSRLFENVERVSQEVSLSKRSISFGSVSPVSNPSTGTPRAPFPLLVSVSAV